MAKKRTKTISIESAAAKAGPESVRRQNPPYPVRIPVAHLKIMRDRGVNVADFIRRCVAHFVENLGKK